MFEWLALLLILLAGLIVGWLLFAAVAAARARQADWLEVGFAALVLGLVFLGWTAVVLAEIGRFSLLNLGTVWLTAVLLCGWFIQRRRRPLFAGIQAKAGKLPAAAKWEAVFLALWLVAASWLFFRPHQYITGAGDAGVYVNLGANIARTGRLLIYDEGLAQLEPSLQAAVLRPVANPVAETYLLPALYVTDIATGEIMPQFYPLHPAWYAVAYALGGVQAELLLTGLWALLGGLAVYLFTRQIARWEVAALALAGLSLSAMQVWFARYPTSESLTQFLLWAGLWATAVWLSGRGPAGVWALVAGCTLGSLFLVRIDILFLLPVLALVVVWQWRRRQPGLLWFILPLTLLVTHSLVHALWQSRPYFYDLYTFAVLSLTRGQTGLLIVALLGAAGLAAFAYFFEPIVRLLETYRRPLLLLLIAGLLGLALYGWFIRPYPASISSYYDQFSDGALPQLDHENLLRLGWYLSPLGIWLGIGGICLLLWRVRWQTAVTLLICLFFTLFYLWHIRNNPTQIYAMRRYVPATLPFFIMGAAYFTGTLFFRGRTPLGTMDNGPRTTIHAARLTAALLALLWLGSIAWAARGFVSQMDYVGLPAQLAALNAQLEPGAVLLWNEQAPIGLGDQLGAPLKFQYGHEVYILRNLEALDTAVLGKTVEKWQNSGRAVYWVGEPAWLVEHDLAYTEMNITLTSSYLEHSTAHKPTAVLPLQWPMRLSRLE